MRSKEGRKIRQEINWGRTLLKQGKRGFISTRIGKNLQKHKCMVNYLTLWMHHMSMNTYKWMMYSTCRTVRGHLQVQRQKFYTKNIYIKKGLYLFWSYTGQLPEYIRTMMQSNSININAKKTESTNNANARF